MISSQVTKNSYETDGVTKDWAYTFPIVDAADIAVFLTAPDGTITPITTNFTVDTVNLQVNYPSVASLLPAIAEGYVVTLARAVPLTQPTGYTSQGSVSKESLEAAFDRIVLMIQDLNEKASRAVKYPIDETPTLADTKDFLATIEARVATATAQAANASASALNADGSEAGALVSANNAANSAIAAAASAESVAVSLSSRFMEGTFEQRPATMPGLGFYYATDTQQEWRYSPTNGWEPR